MDWYELRKALEIFQHADDTDVDMLIQAVIKLYQRNSQLEQEVSLLRNRLSGLCEQKQIAGEWVRGNPGEGVIDLA